MRGRSDVETTAASSAACRAATGRAGGIAQLVRQLRAGPSRVQTLAASTLAVVARDSSQLQAEASQQLVSLLSDSLPPVRRRAARALRDLAVVAVGEATATAGRADGRAVSTEDVKVKAASLKLLGGVEPLVKLLRDGGEAEAKEHALWSLSLCASDASCQRECRQLLLELGCVPAVVECLRSAQHEDAGEESAASTEHAVAIVSTLSSDPMARALILNASGLAPLVALLHEGTSGAKRHAAAAVASLAAGSKEIQLTIMNAGAALPLLGWLHPHPSVDVGSVAPVSAVDDQPEVGAPAAAVPPKGGDGLPLLALQCLEAVVTKNGEAASMLAESGAISLVTKLLEGGHATAERCAAASLVAALASTQRSEVSEAIAADAPCLPALVTLLSETTKEVACEAAINAVWQVTRSSDANQMGVAHAGAIPPLVGLLRGTPESTQLLASAAVEALARGSSENQATLVKHKAVPMLIDVLLSAANASAAAQDHAVGALLCLASDDTSRAAEAVGRKLVTVLEATAPAAAQAKAADALAVLAGRSVATRAAILKAGALPLLVRMLGDGGAAAVGVGSAAERAAALLADLVQSEDSVGELVSSGGVTPLVGMLDLDREQPQTNAARLVWQLSGSSVSRAEIITAGGVAKLVQLLSKGGEEAQRHATAAIWPLCDDDFGVQATIVTQGVIPPLVRVVLHSQVADAQETAASILTELIESPAPDGLGAQAKGLVNAALAESASEDPEVMEMLPAGLREALAGA